jgi:deoxyribonuclease-1-like protein
MRKTILFLIFLFISCRPSAQQASSDKLISICSWNIANMGKSKSDDEIEVMAGVLKDFDVVAIQEVVAGPGGAQAIGRLGDALNRLGNKWEYTISDPTTSTGGGTERYAFMWKPSTLRKKGRAWLDKTFAAQIDREPFMMTFEAGTKSFTLVSFHAVPKSKNPASEIKYLKSLPHAYSGQNLIFCGDFNTPQSDNVFNPLKQLGYKPALVNQKTTLRQNCASGDCLASEYDNFYRQQSVFKTSSAGIIPFYRQFPNTSDARKISDHLPVYLKLVKE